MNLEKQGPGLRSQMVRGRPEKTIARRCNDVPGNKRFCRADIVEHRAKLRFQHIC